MAIYPEDDDLDLERELMELEEAKARNRHDFMGMEERSHHIRKTIKQRQLDPLVAKAIELAQQTGHALGANEALSNKINNLNRRIEVRDKQIEATADRNSWKRRAEAAEATLVRSRATRRRK